MVKENELPQMNNKASLISSDVVEHEIPIAGRFKGPGPAAYTLPSTVGLNAKTGKRAPAYSFGTKIDYDSLEKKCKSYLLNQRYLYDSRSECFFSSGN
jgi:hypothetical protein